MFSHMDFSIKVVSLIVVLNEQLICGVSLCLFPSKIIQLSGSIDVFDLSKNVLKHFTLFNFLNLSIFEYYYT